MVLVSNVSEILCAVPDSKMGQSSPKHQLILSALLLKLEETTVLLFLEWKTMSSHRECCGFIAVHSHVLPPESIKKDDND